MLTGQASMESVDQPIPRRAMILLVAFAGIAGLFLWQWLRLQAQIQSAAQQTRVFEEMRDIVQPTDIPQLVLPVPLIATYLKNVATHPPLRKPDDSPLDEIVERSREDVMREIVAILRNRTPVDLGDDPQVWIKAYSHLIPEDLTQFTAVAEGVRSATSFTLYEGLPHGMWEASELETELKNKKTVERQGSHFYERPLEVNPVDLQELRTLTSTADNFHSFTGEKMCGGFHADYSLVWQDEQATYEFQICFGCGEVLIFGPTQEMRLDLQGNGLKSVLEKYHGQRPPEQ
jgi:hypothetical protein